MDALEDDGPRRARAGGPSTAGYVHLVVRTDWNPVLRGELAEPYWADLQRFVAAERDHHEVYPRPDEVFAALHLTPRDHTRVLVLGQDPYHGPGQAHGLCFSVRPGVEVPPSLRNVHAELHDDLGVEIPDHGNLEAWGHQGVLLLNAVLTVRARQAGSHANKGWERFTDQVIRAVSAKDERVVFVLWGGYARRKQALIDTSRHTVITSAHPSPLSASRGFHGSRPFSRANEALVAAGLDPVDWTLPPLAPRPPQPPQPPRPPLAPRRPGAGPRAAVP